MILAGIRRIAIAYVALLGLTVALSSLFAAASHSSVERANAVGFYILGVLLLAGCFVFGVRGPLRGVSSTGEGSPVLASRKFRVASRDERSETARTAILLFAIGISFVVLGSLIDPNHSTF